jgi:hypothetical protein
LTSEHQNFQLPKENVHNKKSSLNPSEKYVVIGPMHIVLRIHNKEHPSDRFDFEKQKRRGSNHLYEKKIHRTFDMTG